MKKTNKCYINDKKALLYRLKGLESLKPQDSFGRFI